MNNAAALYFFEEFDQSQAKAAAIASSFGFMNLFCRGLGGFFSDYMNKKMHMRGRLLAHILCLIGEGIMIFVFAEQSQLGLAAFALIVFSAFVQSSEGTSYAIVPYIDPENLGAVSGIVGAGGNMGAVCWGLIFLYGDGVKSSLRKLAIIVCCSTILTFFIRIPGHYMLIGGEHNPALQRSNSRKSFKSSNSFDTLPTDNQPRELAQA
jgi:NNP family nitrate/nitrite transporter-like MFS transporter